MKVVVLCNGPIAVPSIDLLIEQGYLSGIAVPFHLGTFPFEMEKIALRHSIPFVMLQRPNINDSLESWLHEIAPDVVFVMLFPYRIAPKVLSIPPLGFWNWHPGLLPQYRGPDPIFWEIRNQERYGAITVHQMDENFDSGPILFTERVEILPADSYSDHAEKLEHCAKRITNRVLSMLSRSPDDFGLVPQDEQLAAYQKAPKVWDRTIDWKGQDAASVLALVRACNLYGGAITYFRGSAVFIQRASPFAEERVAFEPGVILRVEPLAVSCSDIPIRIEQVCAGDRVHTGAEFCEAFAPRQGECFRSGL